jgi:quinol monooxygenase YgiN
MNTIIFRMRIKEGKEEAALEQLRKMASAVEANEPGALAYIAHRTLDDPNEVVFFELYEDDAAFKLHGETPHMAEMRASVPELFDLSQVKMERLDRVGGFSRQS